MKIGGKVHCFFEQSGTFKNEFIKLGIQAKDYDIQNNFNQTDYVMDLFKEIDDAFERERERETVFNRITKDDLIIAFYPCIYFCATSQMLFSLEDINYRKLGFRERIDKILDRDKKRLEFYERLIKLVSVCVERGLRLIIENPWSEQTYLKANFIKAPDVVDNNRLLRGDYYKKPTAYWYWNCSPTHGESWQKDKEQKTIRSARQGKNAGICSEERSLISPDYARNFICDFIIGKKQKNAQMDIFDYMGGETDA